ncbi:DUF3854 domain-containing protein, partial [Microcoleus sp. B7-D4]
MVSILPNSANSGQELSSLSNFSQDSAILDKFGKDYAEYVNQCCYEDVVVRSGVAEDIYDLNFPSAIGTAVYEPIFADSDKTNNSSISLEAARNLARCIGDAGYFYKNKFWLLSDLCGASEDARNGNIKAKGIFRPAGPAAGGWIANGRFRQLTGATIALDEKGKERRYHQPKGKPLEIFFPAVTVRVGRMIAEKARLPMPEFPVIGLGGEWIGFWDWAESSGCPIVITEGEKKAALLISRGWAAIGLPGITTGYRVTERGETITKPDGT